MARQNLGRLIVFDGGSRFQNGKNPVCGPLKGSKLIVDAGKTLDGGIDPGEGIDHGQEFAKCMMKIDFSDNQDQRHYKEHR